MALGKLKKVPVDYRGSWLRKELLTRDVCLTCSAASVPWLLSVPGLLKVSSKCSACLLSALAVP